jgi:hypothetical protein
MDAEILPAVEMPAHEFSVPVGEALHSPTHLTHERLLSSVIRPFAFPCKHWVK